MRILRDGPLRPRGGGRERSAKEVLARLHAVQRQGDRALFRDPKATGSGAFTRGDFRRAYRRLGPGVRAALEAACRHVGAVSRRELAALKQYDLRPTSGVTVYHRRVPLAAVGILVPPGRLSVLLSCAIEAAVAGVQTRVVCTPPAPDGGLDPLLAAAAYMTDVTSAFTVDATGALAALSHGTATVPAVERIVGQGGAEARVARQWLGDRCALDVRPGPGALLILADQTASAEFVAADLLAQAERGPEAECALIALDPELAPAVQAELRRQMRGLPRADPLRGPLRRARALVVSDPARAVQEANAYAPATLSLQVQRPDDWLAGLRSYGTVLVGPHTPAVLAEYATGAPVLQPEGGTARFRGATRLQDLQRPVDIQQVDASAYPRLARVASTLADLEGRPQAARALHIRIYGRDEDG